MFEKSETPPAQAWVDAQCAKFEELLQAFTAEQRAHFRRKALEGRDRWDNPAMVERLHTDLLAHAAGVPLAAGEEAHVGNFAAFLWGIRTGRVKA